MHAREEKYERSRERSQNERLQKSKSMGNTLNLQYNRWRAEKNRQDESYLEFTRSAEDMHARQQKQADDAKYRCFVSDVEEKRARHGIFGDLQKANHDRNKREQESFQNANLVHVTLRNKALANIQAQRDEMQAMRQKMFMELGVKADEAKDVFYRLKGENDPDKIARMLKKLNVDLPDVRKTLDPNWVDPAKAAAAAESSGPAKPLF